MSIVLFEVFQYHLVSTIKIGFWKNVLKPWRNSTIPYNGLFMVWNKEWYTQDKTAKVYRFIPIIPISDVKRANFKSQIVLYSCLLTFEAVWRFLFIRW